MDTKELKEKYHSLYEYMAVSNEPKYMMMFGSVMNEMMDWMIDNKPEAASEWIDKLCSIKWKNYLTRKEAEKIVSEMVPKAPWNYATWETTMESMGMETEEPPCYNSYALWVTMNMIHSDDGESIAEIKGVPLAQIPAEQLVRIIHRLAMNKLKDKDGVFCIRRYFEDKI